MVELHSFWGEDIIMYIIHHYKQEKAGACWFNLGGAMAR